MGLVYADIELINGGDLALAARGFISIETVKRVNVKVLVNPKVSMLVINEVIQLQLQLSVSERRKFIREDGSIAEYDIASCIELRFKNRRTTCRAIILPGNGEPILGSIPFNDMDVKIDTSCQELIVNPDYPDMALVKLK